jgi:hypothetical protein
MKMFPFTAVILTTGGAAVGVGVAVLEIGDGVGAVGLPTVGSSDGTAVVVSVVAEVAVAAGDMRGMHACNSAAPRTAASATPLGTASLLIPEGFDGLQPGRPICRVYPEEKSHCRGKQCGQQDRVRADNWSESVPGGCGDAPYNI